MKKGKKLALGGVVALFSALLLTGCTNSFCSNTDKAHMLYAYDYGVMSFYDGADTAKPAEAVALDGYNNVYYTATIDNEYNSYLNSIVNNAKSEGIITPSLDYFVEFDKTVLNHIVAKANLNATEVTAAMIGNPLDGGLLKEFGYIKFYGGDKIWDNWDAFDNEVRLNSTLSIDECPSVDFINAYKSNLNSAIANYRSCLTITTGDYGFYNGRTAEISGKSYGYAWETGFFSGLLVYPIGCLIDVFTSGMLNNGVMQGLAQILSIIFVTLIVRTLMLLITFKQTMATGKMQELQPELAKIQAKYPNSNTNNYERQRLAEETSKLYKKNHINPLGSLLIMFVQFPVFICVWGALQGSAWLSTGSFLGLNLSSTISSVLFNGAGWQNGSAVTALILFLLMAGSQTVAMLLPQWIQKKNQKKVAKLGRNPAQTQQNKQGKWFTYIMLAMIIVMGFSLASAMGVYWFVGAIFSIIQTVITQAITKNKKSKKVVR